jgi:plasmid stability protein
MAQIIVRNLSSEVVESLKKRAERNQRSLEAEVRIILEQASEQLSWEESWERIDAFRERMARSGRKFTDSGEILSRIRNSE